MHGKTLFVAHQGKTAGENAAIGEGGEQLPGMNHAGLLALHQDRQRAAGALGEPQGAFAVAGDLVALGLGVGEFRGFQPDFEAGEPIAPLAKLGAGRQFQPFAADDDALRGVADLGAEHTQCEPGADP